jgi:YidC/Oxa1 family membrane protein insertase
MKALKLVFTAILFAIALPTHAGLDAEKIITIKTDFLYIEINSAGGNIQHLDLLKCKGTNDQSKPFVLFQQQDGHVYVAQSGLLGKGLPTHNAEFSVARAEYHLADGKDTVEVRLTALESDDARVTKAYIFHRASYLVDVVYEIENRGTTVLTPAAYFQFVRDSSAGSSSKFDPTFIGPVVYTKQGKLQKIRFPDIERNKVKLPVNPNNGWIGMLQPDFVSAWLPATKGPREFYTKQLEGNLFSAGVLLPIASIEPGQFGHISTTLYAGPAKSSLNNIAPGLGMSGLLP